MRSLILSGWLLLLGTSASAFDFGALIDTVTPVAQSAAPVADTALSANPLVKNLTTNLGVTPTQAVGGTAAILNDARSKMPAGDFASLTKQMPEVNTLLSAAPTGIMGTGNVQSQFSALGMDPSMVGKFTPLVLQYLQSGTTPGLAQVLQTALVP